MPREGWGGLAQDRNRAVRKPCKRWEYEIAWELYCWAEGRRWPEESWQVVPACLGIMLNSLTVKAWQAKIDSELGVVQ